MALPTNKIKKIKLPNSTEAYEIIPERLQNNGFEASLPTLSTNSTIALKSDVDNSVKKSGDSMSGNLNPATNKGASLGTSSLFWNNIYGTTLYENGTSLVDKYANKSHTHTKSQITDFSHTHSKSEVGLGNVDNTADANKSVKYATTAGTANSVPEANLTWGGKNFSGSYGPIDAAMVPSLGANRLAFVPAAGVTVEYSRDAGSTWTDYGLNDTQKTALFSGPQTSTGAVIGKPSRNSSTKKYENVSVNNRLRVTLKSDAAHVYTALNKFVIYCSTNGSTGCKCTIQGLTKNNYDAGNNSWTTFADGVDIAGWSGFNVINTSSIITYSNNSSQYIQIRFTFYCTGNSSMETYGGLSIINIYGFGGVGWRTPSNMAKWGQLYSYDAGQNVFFPANVAAKTISVDTINGQTLGNTIVRQNTSTGDVILGSTARKLRLCGNQTRPSYSKNESTYSDLALLSDIPRFKTVNGNSIIGSGDLEIKPSRPDIIEALTDKISEETYPSLYDRDSIRVRSDGDDYQTALKSNGFNLYNMGVSDEPVAIDLRYKSGTVALTSDIPTTLPDYNLGYYDTITANSDGTYTITRKTGYIDLGKLHWIYDPNNNQFYSNEIDNAYNENNTWISVVCNTYIYNIVDYNDLPTPHIRGFFDKRLYVVDETLNRNGELITGVIQYQLATATTEKVEKNHYARYNQRFILEHNKSEAERSCNLYSGVQTCSGSDTKTYFQPKLQGYKNDTLVWVKSSDDITSVNKLVSFTFNKTSDINKIAFGHNGSAHDILMYYDVTNLPNGTYTLSFLVTGYTGTQSFTNIMLNEGSVALPYQPYEGKVVHEKELESAIGDIATILDTINGEVI